MQAYLGAYDKSFDPPGRQTRSAWEKEREARLAILMKQEQLAQFQSFSEEIAFDFGSVVYGIAVFALAGIERVRPAGIGTVIANAACTVIALIAVFTMALTTAGVVVVIGAGLYTLAMAELQYVGVRRIPA